MIDFKISFNTRIFCFSEFEIDHKDFNFFTKKKKIKILIIVKLIII